MLNSENNNISEHSIGNSITETKLIKSLTDKLQNLKLTMTTQTKIPLDFKTIEMLPIFDGTNSTRFLEHCQLLIDTFYDTTNLGCTQNKFLLQSIKSKFSNAVYSKVSSFSIDTWAQMKEVLLQQFGDPREESEILQTMLKLKQYNTSVDIYYDQFSKLLEALINKTVDIRKALYMNLAIEHFIKNLHPQIRVFVQNKNPTTLPNAYEIAKQTELAYADYFKITRQKQVVKQQQNQNFKINKPNFNTPQITYPVDFPSQPINIQSKPQSEKRFFTNQQVFGKPKPVFGKNIKPQNFKEIKPTPMSIQNTTVHNIQKKPFVSHFQNYNQKPNFHSEELFETENADQPEEQVEEISFDYTNDDELNNVDSDENTQWLLGQVQSQQKIIEQLQEQLNEARNFLDAGPSLNNS
ncbi:hypothetical protein ILUMI_20302 [Ignelater luminosus]|uniref:Ty3 transposon capsid-like protein domain-containing protein n=1 Tax=Ignelater luminosus TaxID=2038154 RepID=A0A8K0G4Q6_IGNLU|nr:hypothetical protein ILUMI_20302 [Ignelater luminosus]